jgi:protein-S-isoprenylcysteine O-methyltransferase Ste14
VGWALVLLFIAWNGWAVWLFGRHRTGLLRGQATETLVEEGPYRFSRNPPYVGLLALYRGLPFIAPTARRLVLFPAAVLLVYWGRDPARGAFRPPALRCSLRRLHEAGASVGDL